MEPLFIKVTGKLFVENTITCIGIMKKNSFRIFKEVPLNQCCAGCSATIDGFLTNRLEGTLKILENSSGNI